MQANDDYILLLSKQFSGDISPAETVLLNNWLAQSPENERLATELRQVWESTCSIEKSFSPDLDAAFRQVQAKIRTAEQPRTKVIPFSQWLVRAAAVIALIVAGVWSWREFSTPPEMIAVAVSDSEKLLFNLPDGSRVWLRVGSEMQYLERFDDAERRIKCAGEAYFEIKHDPKRPFFVDLPNGDFVKVLGTEFGIRHDSEDGMYTNVYVRSGKVFFSPKLQPEGVVLTTRQKASYNRAAKRLLVDENASLNELSWQTGGLEFVSTPMREVIEDLENFYSVKISLPNPDMQNCLHTAPLTNQSIEKVLESLALTYQFRVTTPAPDGYVLAGGKCQ